MEATSFKYKENCRTAVHFCSIFFYFLSCILLLTAKTFLLIMAASDLLTNVHANISFYPTRDILRPWNMQFFTYYP